MGCATIGLISQTVRYALDSGYDVLLEGILDAERYGEMLEGLQRDHVGATHFHYFSVSLEETLRRHASRPQASLFGAEEMREWHREDDLLPFVAEQIVGEADELAATVMRIEAELLPLEDHRLLRQE